jgi:SAM-dependent methyltransferase
MDPIDVFSSKAENYARYRWGYAPEAIQIIFDQTGITEESCVADIGAGTGILTQEFVGKVGIIYAVEPNPDMRGIVARNLSQCQSCQIINGRAEATTLDSHSVDLITAAQSVHWFEPEATRVEFSRILKPGGWLAICRNYGADPVLGDALQGIFPVENDTESLMVGRRVPRSFYFGDNDYIKMDFPFNAWLTWEEFFGSLATASFAPDEDSLLYAQFECSAKEVFDRFSIDGQIESNGITELYLGRVIGK